MEWIQQNNRLKKPSRLRIFSQAFAFMTRVALIAEKMDPPSMLDKYL